VGQENSESSSYDVVKGGLEEIFRAHGQKVKVEIRTHIPATVVAYDPTTNRATVTVQHLRVVRVRDLTRPPKAIVALKGVPPDAEATLAPIVLTQIPVAQLVTTRGRFTVPIDPGDTGMLHVSDRALEKWLLSGVPADPGLALTHDLKDSVFYPGLAPVTKPAVPPIDSAATVVDGTPNVKLGSLAVSPVPRWVQLVAAIDALLAAGNAAGTGSPGTTGAAAFAAAQGAWNAAKAGIPSTKVLVE